MNTIRALCSHCGHEMQLPATLVGKQGKCPACGQITTIALSKETPQQEIPPQTSPFPPLPQQEIPPQTSPLPPLPQQGISQQAFPQPDPKLQAFTSGVGTSNHSGKKVKNKKERKRWLGNIWEQICVRGRFILGNEFGGIYGARSPLPLGNNRYPNLTKYLDIMDFLLRLIFIIGIGSLLVGVVLGLGWGLYLLLSNPFGYYAGGGPITISIRSSADGLQDGAGFAIEYSDWYALKELAFEFDFGGGVREGKIPVSVTDEMSAHEVAKVLTEAIASTGEFGGVGIKEGNQIQVYSDRTNDSLNSFGPGFPRVDIEFSNRYTSSLSYRGSSFLESIVILVVTPFAGVIYYFVLIWYRILALAGIEFIRVVLDTEQNTRV